MSERTALDNWLDRWEELHEDGRPRSVDEFIVLQGPAPQELIAAFRATVSRLQAMDARLDAAAPSTANSLDADTGGSAERIFRFGPGEEPVPGYRLETRLGAGGFGEVWKAKAPGGLPVALKFVRLGHRVGDTERHALTIMKEVRHPNLLAVVGSWEIDSHLIIAMELADRSLLNRLKEAKAEGLSGIPRDELLGYMADAARGLDHLHTPHLFPGEPEPVGLQHRDVKPHNLLLSGGGVKVGDFGLVRILRHAMTAHSGSMTYAYAAPEFFADRTSNQSDQYSLAVTYCELRGGRLPFAGTAAQLMRAHLEQAPDLAMLPAEEREVVKRALAKNPADRWPSCAAFVEALGHAKAPGVSIPPAVSRTWKRRLAVMVISGAAILALIVGLTLPPRNLSPIASVSQNQPGDVASLPAAPLPTTLAVLDFENHSQDASLDGFRQGLRDMLVTDLAKVSALAVVERSRLSTVLNEHKLAKGDFIDPATASRLGKGLAAQRLLAGSYLITGEQVRVNIRVIAVETGAIVFADSVTGSKADFLAVQRALTSKIVDGLKVRLTDADRHLLGQSAIKDFEAFRLYSDALAALQLNQQAEAEARLRQAMARDPEFRLARQELGRLETLALIRLGEGERERMARAGKVGKAMATHQENLQIVITTGKRDAAYFAALISLSAHAGLRGDADRERKLLLLYWRAFTDHVPADQALAVGAEMNKILTLDGKFFQEQLDGGNDTVFMEGLEKPEKYLKPELRDSFRWPMFSALWPFDTYLRMKFFGVNKKFGIKADPGDFEKQLPRLPHHYVRKLIERSYRQGGEVGPVEALTLQFTIARYYASAVMPADAHQDLGELYKQILVRLDFKDPYKWPHDVVREAVVALDAVAKSAGDDAVRRRADELLVRYARQAKINSGDTADPPPKADQPQRPSPRFCSLELKGSPVTVLCDLDYDILNRQGRYVSKQLSDLVLDLPSNQQLNVRLYGDLPPEVKRAMFTEPKALDVEGRRQAQNFLAGLKAGPQVAMAKKQTDLVAELLNALKEWPQEGGGEGSICVVSLSKKLAISEQQMTLIQKALNGKVRLYYAGKERIPSLGILVKQSGGSAVVLKDSGLLIEPEPWDLSKLP
ncbi:MAG: protein kinase [Planctomycetes bacterium]|nr:protein kinase [Planctomycetota bacterium]